MSELVWINGRVVPMGEARVGIEDRGFQFADGVYEVIRLYDGKPFTLDRHLQRLANSAKGIKLAVPQSSSALESEIESFVERAGISEGMIYLQLTRGESERNHAFPNCEPTLLFFVRALDPLPEPGTGAGVKLITVVDERWKRCWIKSIALLPNVLAKNEALDGGADEAVFVEDGIVTECSSSNLFIVHGDHVLTHPVGNKVLPGVTRAVLLDIAPSIGIRIEERAIKEAEAAGADEVFITSTTREISWASKWNGQTIGSGRCGPITQKLHEALRGEINREINHMRGSSRVSMS
jgi:D-alanine transaminase